MSIVIQWKKGSKLTGSAEKAYSELETIRHKQGDITPAAVLKRAEVRSSALHRHFEWNDSVAAEKHRLEQARKLIRSIEVIHVESPKTPVKAYSVVTKPTKSPDEPPKKVYQSTEEALQDPVMRDEILGNAIRDAISFRRRYQALQELSQVFTAIDEFVESARL